MAKVRIDGVMWDANQIPIPESREAELVFRPLQSEYASGLVTDREVPARAFNLATGAFIADLESDRWYIPIVRWLNGPSDWGNRGRGQTEWPAFNSAGGGPITTLFPPRPTGTIVAELGPPPPNADGIVWIDLTNVTGDGVLVYAPEGN